MKQQAFNMRERKMPYKKFEEYNIQVTDDVKERYQLIISDLGEDITREGLTKTPERAAKAMQFLTQGYEQDAVEILRSAMFKESYNEIRGTIQSRKKVLWNIVNQLSTSVTS